MDFDRCGEIVEKLNKEINAGLADPTFKARMADLGGVPMSMTPADFGKLIAVSAEGARCACRRGPCIDLQGSHGTR